MVVSRWALALLPSAAIAGVACALPQQVVPPYEAGADSSVADGAPEATGSHDAGDAAADTTLSGADASDATTDGDGAGGPQPDAFAPESGPPDSGPADVVTIESGPEAGIVCDAGCVAYVVSDVTGDAGLVTVVSLSPLAVLETIPVGHNPWRVAFTPDGRKAYVTEGSDGTVTVIDAATRQVKTTIPVTSAGGSSVRGIAVSPDGKSAFVSDGAHNQVAQIDVATDTLTSTKLTVAAPGPYGLAFSPDGGELWAGGAGGNGVARFSSASLTPVGTITGAGGNLLGDRIAFRPDFSAAFVNSGSGCPCCGELEKLDPAAGTSTYSQSWAASGYGLAVAPGGTTLYATSELTPTVCSAASILGSIWVADTTTDTYSPKNSWYTYNEPRGLVIAPGGAVLVVAGYNANGANPGVTEYDAKTLLAIGPPLAITGLPQDIALQP